MDKVYNMNTPFCGQHPENQAIYIKASLDSNQIFKCQECILEDTYNKDYLSIKTISKCQDEYIFMNWPPLEDLGILSEIRGAFQYRSDLIKGIEQAFDGLIKEIVDALEQKKKAAMQTVINESVKWDEILKVYNDTAEKKKLKQIIKIEKQNMECKLDDLRCFISEKIQQKQQNTKILQQQLDKIKEYQILQMVDMNLFKHSIVRQLEEFNPLTNKRKNSYEQIDEVKKQLNFLIGNKLNHVRPSFIQQFNNLFDKVSYAFLELQIDDIFTSKPLNYMILIEDEALYIQKIAQQMIKDKENMNIVSQIYEKAMNCNYDQSNLIQVVENIYENIIQIQKDNEDVYGGIYFKYELTKNKKYVVRFRFNDQAGDCFIIGLVSKSSTTYDLNKTHQGKLFCNDNIHYCGNVIQGDLFYEIQKDQVIEMRVDIQAQQIQFLDYPNYQKVNQLNEEYKLNSEETYYIALHFGINEKYKTRIDLIYFQEIDYS
ncbi:hypothetical protein TTHERM_001178678 (macronuclear) [Tetrahymena thermophila SB210]|uniref:Uncharacterized protein n=1 Tax=Tetrahymena thermophila (strain SB210) TaxID=312017 RepID=W7X5A5_TETTS|nr:hypothetical protein TTHERM_001178678 [Tetrahymena thermophila SB210]EWS72587.1 hypothetical protein TTHERM_001178678 [Tetrahymena thermophila SB210]|eukprot:XP_012654870.1 hypothetical protein TTHERM_001178678 [Tetrahymena thermophila SB210]